MHARILITIVCLGQLSQTPAPSKKTPENIEVRYARAKTQLAEANLNRVEQSNKRVAGSVPSSVVAEYQRDVNVAKTRLEQAAAGRTADGFQVWLQRAEAEQSTAETALKSAVEVNSRVPGTFAPLDIERFRLRAEVAKLQFQRGKSLVDSSLEAQLQWEIDLLDNQVERLKEQSRHSAPTIHSYQYWPWP
jgi:hypothetical protein